MTNALSAGDIAFHNEFKVNIVSKSFEVFSNPCCSQSQINSKWPNAFKKCIIKQ